VKLYLNDNVDILSTTPKGGYTLEKGPYAWIDDLENYKGKKPLVINQMTEGFPLLDKDYERIHKSFPRKRIFYITSNLLEPKRYKRWWKNQNKFSTKIQIVAQPVWAEIVKTDFTPIDIKEYNDTRECFYNCLNRQPREYRLYLVQNLQKKNLIKNNFVSFPYHSLLPDSPLIVDRNDFCTNWATNMNKDIYLNSWFSIVNETFYEEDAEYTMFHSEKIFKTILAGHPFILFGQHKSLRSLKRMGFKTFGKLWPEDYDSIVDPKERLQKIIDTIEYMCKLDWKEIWPSVQKIVEYNQSFLLKNTFSDYD